MKRLEYDDVEFKAGLEIHQQLDTRKKLFCRCKSRLIKEEEDFTTVRYFRPTLSETGDIDPTALKAFKKRKKVVYSTKNSENCLYELNEVPPYELNKNALEIAFFISKMLNAEIPDLIPVSRKQYLDGSVPSGFQRTMIVGFNGSLELSSGKTLKIEQICLEEDAARKMKETTDKVVFQTDRLGIPLLEVTTAPQINTLEEVHEAALKLGRLFRSTENAKRGIGSIRQDLNISIKSGSRVEIKGVQRPDWFTPLIKEEIKRQQSLIQITTQLKERGVQPDQIEAQELHKVSSLFRRTNANFISKALSKGKNLFAVKLPQFKSLLGTEIQKERTFGKEFAERVSVNVGLGGILHTDELPAYNISKSETEKLFEATSAKEEKDCVVVIIGSRTEAEDALEEIKERAIQSLFGVPEETRRAHEDGTTSFERPLGTAARLYPDTDIPPIQVKASLLAKVKRKLEETKYPWEKEEEYRELGLSKRFARKLSTSPKASLFERIVEKGGDPQLVASILIEKRKELKRDGYAIDAIRDEKIAKIFDQLRKEKIAKEVIPDILKKLAEDPGKKVEEVIDALGIAKITREELEQIVEEIIAKNREYISEEGKNAFKGLMGDLMKQVKGKIDGSVAAKILRDKLTSFINKQGIEK